jgi:hypothetical protein
MPVFRVEGHTQDFPGVPFQAMTAFEVERQSGKYIIDQQLLYIKKPGDCDKLDHMAGFVPSGRNLEIAANSPFPVPARICWKGAAMEELYYF